MLLSLIAPFLRSYNSEKTEPQTGDAVLEPVLLKYGVELVLEGTRLPGTFPATVMSWLMPPWLAGHMHSYQRTWPVYQNHTYLYPSNTTFVDPPAPVYVIQGTSGA